MRNQEIREFLEASKRNGWELTKEKVVKLLDSGITLNDAFISSSIIMPTRQEVEARTKGILDMLEPGEELTF